MHYRIFTPSTNVLRYQASTLHVYVPPSRPSNFIYFHGTHPKVYSYTNPYSTSLSLRYLTLPHPSNTNSLISKIIILLPLTFFPKNCQILYFSPPEIFKTIILSSSITILQPTRKKNSTPTPTATHLPTRSHTYIFFFSFLEL